LLFEEKSKRGREREKNLITNGIKCLKIASSFLHSPSPLNIYPCSHWILPKRINLDMHIIYNTFICTFCWYLSIKDILHNNNNNTVGTIYRGYRNSTRCVTE